MLTKNIGGKLVEETLQQILDGQTKIIKRLDNIENYVLNVKNDISNVKSDLSNVKSDISNIKGQLDENTQIVKGIRHNIETSNAEINGLKLNTLSKDALSHLSTKDDINKLHSKFEVLNSRLFHQEAELYELKAVK